jgi:hypothetical protein
MASSEGVAAHFVDNMNQDTQEEFANITATAKVYRPGHLKVAEDLIKSPGHAEMLFTPRGKRMWKVEGRVPTTQRPSQPEKLILSEDNKEHLKIIVAALVSDMMPGIQRLVAADPRIQRFSLSNSPRFKEMIIKKYKEDLAARRKNEISLLRTAARLAKANVSTQAYRAIRNILVQMGFRDVLPVWKDISEARGEIEKCANVDLQLTATEHGWFISPTALIEIDLLRRLQMPSANMKMKKHESGGRAIGFSGPGMHGWQNKWTVKITLDARSITKKTSHTDMSMQTFDEGEAGEAESHRALSLRTLGIWMGKDSREKVQVNTPDCWKEIQQIAEHGVVFNREEQTFLGQAAAFRKLSELEQQALCPDGQKKYCPVKIQFVFSADMAAQCAVFGHGCAGNHYCGFCMAHEEDRHLPYKLVTTEEEVSFQAMAHKYDMHARTLYAINTGLDHKGVQILTADGLRNSTAMDAAAREAAARADMQREAEANDGSRRAKKRAKKVPVAKSEPDKAVLERLVGWRQPSQHTMECSCSQCLIPKGTCVRVIPNIGFERPSEFLKEHCPAITAEMCPFCALHCNMRVTETLFYQICQAAETSCRSKQLIERMNTALRDLGINRSYKESLVTKKYEKISFEGHQAWRLLDTGTDGKMGIQRVLDAMWPGAAEDSGVGKAYGIKFVPRVMEVWRQWAVVANLMSERFSKKLKEDVVDGEDGFARFGKECREFIFRFQSMSTVDYSKSYYLHTLLHHAGGFMRALGLVGLTLGMLSNSAAERKHEYGRRASRKALASNGWRKKSKQYAETPNLLVYLTMKEINMWEYGEDLVSHEIARRCQAEAEAGDGPASGEPSLLAGGRVNWSIQPRRNLNPATVTSASGEDADLEPPASESLNDEDGSDDEPLLSVDEVRAEFEAGPNDPPPSFETSNKKIWGERDRTKAFALIGLQCKGEEEPGDFDPDCQSILFDGLPVYVTDDAESVQGSESEEDLQLTINSFDFPEQGEDEDESFTILEEAEERDLAAEPLEWDTPKGEATDAHDASGSAALARTEPAAKKTGYSRRRPGQQTPTLHAATAPAASAAATGSQLPLQPASGPQAEPVQPAGVVPVQRAQAVPPAGFTFMGSASDSCCGARRPAPAASARRGAGRRPAPQAARRRPGPA